MVSLVCETAQLHVRGSAVLRCFPIFRVLAAKRMDCMDDLLRNMHMIRYEYLMMIKWADIASLCARGLGKTERDGPLIPLIWFLWSLLYVVVLIVIRSTWEWRVLNWLACVCGVLQVFLLWGNGETWGNGQVKEGHRIQQH
jgi:hypothetical protein